MAGSSYRRKVQYESLDITLTADQIRQGFTSPPVLLRCPSVSKMIVPIGYLVVNSKFSDAVWATNTNGFIGYNNGGSLSAISANLSNLLTQGGDRVQTMNTVLNDMSAGFAGKNLVFYVTVGDPTGGGTNTLRIRLSYKVIDI